MDHYDVVIVGSGFGGSVMAYRLAEQGKRVCVLERGKKHPPGEHTRVLQGIRSNFWDPSQGLYGLFNVWFFRNLGALVSSGLGGGSLIYANVLHRKDEKWFVKEDLDGGYEHWPIDRATLDPHYDKVQHILEPTRYPSGPRYDAVEKVRAFREAAARLVAPGNGLSVVPLDLAITFGAAPGQPFDDPNNNLHGIQRHSCTLCAECVVGCTNGAKNTLDMTYLSRAERHGARLETNHEVSEFVRSGSDNIEVRYVIHDPNGGPRPQTPAIRAMTCRRLVIAAGAFGSTYLMLRNHASFGIEPTHVGTRFSGNGDLLSFALNSTRPGGAGKVPYAFDPTRGPTITTALRQADRLDTGNPHDGPGFYIEDAAFPKELAWLIEGLNAPGWLGRGLRFVREFVRRTIGSSTDSDIGAELSELIGNADLSSRTMPLLSMGRDVPDGAFHLRGNRLQLDWSKRRSAEYFDRVAAVARRLAEDGLGGKYLRHPPTYVFQRAVTVHPLGGLPMGMSKASGVVDSFGRTFGDPRLWVVDGSILPGPVGPNPAFTIAAVADRAADEMLRTWPA